MSILLPLLSLICINLADYPKETECTTVTGNAVTEPRSKSIAECDTTAGYTIVSCGYVENLMSPKANEGMPGSYIESNRCVAINRASDDTCTSCKLTARARCCKLHPSVTCRSRGELSPKSASGSTYCYTASEIPVGCSKLGWPKQISPSGSGYVYANFGGGNGGKHGSCTGMNTEKSQIYAQCCRSKDESTVQLKCKRVDGSQTTSDDVVSGANANLGAAYSISRIRCDNKWFMTSCGGSSAPWNTHLIYYRYVDATTNECRVVNAGGSTPYGQKAIATCCQEIIVETPNPTSAPTEKPTPAPIEKSTTEKDICNFPECTSDVALDIIFLMDESGSIDENEWQTMVSFVKRLIRDDINDASYVSLVEYGSIGDFNVFKRFSRATEANKQALFKALDNNVFSRGGSTYTADAIERTLPLFSGGSYARRHLLFLLTDGESTNPICPKLENVVRNSAVEIVVIGIGSSDGLNPFTWTNSIQCLCDVRTNAFFVKEFSTKEFNRIEADLRGKTCTYTQQANALSFESKFLPDSSSSYLSGSQNENKIIMVLFVCLVFSWIGLLFAWLKLKRYNEVNMYSKAHQNDPEE